MLSAGANPHKVANRGVFLGKGPLMWASSQGRADVVRLLLMNGVDANYASKDGNFKVIGTNCFCTLSCFMCNVSNDF